MRILPAPYDKYVYDIDSNDLYSLKTKHFNRITKHINSVGQGYWSIIVDSRYHQSTLSVASAIKLYEQGTEYKEPKNDSYMLKLVKNSEVKTIFYSLMSKLNADAIFYIKQGYTVSLYNLSGELELIPEKVIVKT